MNTETKSHRWLAAGPLRWPLAGLLLGASASMAYAATSYDVLVNHELYLQETGTSGAVVDNGPVGGQFILRAKTKINGQSGTLANVQLTETLPINAIFQGYTPPAGATCAAPLPGTVITAANANIVCTLPTVSAAAFTNVDFRIVLPTESTGWKAYASTAAVPGNTDTDAGNNSNIERGITTYARADLAVAITAPTAGATVVQGDVVNYLVDVTNAASTYAFDLKAGEKAVLRFNQPQGTVFQGTPSGTDWSCQAKVDNTTAPVTNYQECTYTVPQGQTVAKGAALPQLTFPVQVQATGQIAAQASVLGQDSGSNGFAESVWDNNTASVQVNATPNLKMDMALSKTVDRTTLDADAGADVPVVYTLAVSRVSGTVNPADVTVVDTLPAGVSYVGLDASSSNWTCMPPSGQAITCTYSGSLALGSNPAQVQPLKINALVAQSALVNNATLQNTGVLTVSNETESVGANNTASVTSTVKDNANLKVTKIRSSSVVASGTAYYYSIPVENLGPLDVRAGQVITITDQLDSRLEFVGVTGSSLGWSCTPSGGSGSPLLGALLTCTNGSGIAYPQTSTLRLNVIPHLPSGSGQFAVIGNTANLTGVSGRDPVTAITNAVDVNLSEKVADLSITKAAAITQNSSSYGADASGSEVVYTLKVKNTDPNPAAGEVQEAKTVVVTDTVNNLINTVRAAAAGVSTYPANSRYLVATVALPVGSTVTADACTLSGANSDTSSNVRCVLHNVPVDDDAEYTITIRARQYVDPTDASTQTRQINNTGTVSSTDTAEYTGTGAKPNSATASVTLRALADMTVTKTPNPANAAAGQDIGYVLTARNNGPSQAVGVQVEDVLPIGALWVSQPVISGGTCVLGDGAGDTTPIVIGAAVATPHTHLVCTWTGSAAGFNLNDQKTVQYHLRSVTKNPPAKLDNAVKVSTATPETKVDNNDAAATVTLGASQVDVQINMRHSADAIALNSGNTQYTITVTNSGASTSYATGVVMTETFPTANSGATFEFVSLDSVASSDASHVFDLSACTTVPVVGTTSGTLVCNFPWLKPGEKVDIKFTMKPVSILDGKPTGTIYHSATVTADVEQLPGQDVAANNATTDRTSTYDPTQVSNPDELKFIDLSITKDATGYSAEGVQVGDTIAYTLVVKNEEDPAAVPRLDLVGGNAVVEDVLPAGLTLQGAAPNGCGYDDVARKISCTIVNLQAGATQSYAFTVTVQQLAAGQASIDNTATVTSPGDPKEPNNTSTKKVPSLSGFDLALTKSVDQAQAKAGDTLTYTLLVTNHGPASSQAGQISDPLPAGLGFVASADGCTAAGTVVTCAVEALAANASKSFTFTAQIADTVTGPATLANTATVSADGDTDEGNNHGTATTEVPKPDMPVPPVKPPTPVPTLTQWGQMLMACLLALLGWGALRRRAD